MGRAGLSASAELLVIFKENSTSNDIKTLSLCSKTTNKRDTGQWK